MVSYFMVTGVTPLACANALSWYIRSESEPKMTDVYFITSGKVDGSESPKSIANIDEVLKLLEENLERLAPGAFAELTFHTDEIIWIPEERIDTSVRIITEICLKKCPENSQLIIDPTAGRKTMSSSAVVAGVILHQKYKRKVLFSYYWLRRFERSMLSKRAYEIGIDEAETILTKVEDIDDELKQIKG